MVAHVQIDATLVVKNCSTIRTLILDALNNSDTISLDLVDDQVVDLCGLQLIESARRQARAVGKTLVLEHPVTGFRSVLDAAGFLTEAASDDLQFWFHEGSAQ
jgi:anti-anti-sigma regulatory factor